ncbi:MAG: lytic transglycosylase domain-containing protein [Xanthobacteraceae bacterium]
MLLDALAGANDRVTTAIRSASRTTGTTFDYLLKTAMRESSLDPGAAAKTSSARGLYQFIESTWLSMVKEEGPKYGLGGYAAAIERGADGQYLIRDPIARAHILKLREDPQISAVMAGALAGRNSEDLGRSLGRKPTSGELYLAHFLGAGGAKRLLTLKGTNPNASAAAAFPEAARANKSIFYGDNGKPRSAADVLATLTERHDGVPVRPKPAAPTAFAQLRPTLPAEPVSKPTRAAAPERVVFDHPINPGRSAFAPEEGPAFQALFRNSAQSRAALSPAVRELWGGNDPLPRRLAFAVMETKLSPLGGVGEPLNLLDHMKPLVAQSGRRTKL